MPDTQTKRCGKCRETLPLTSFHKASREKSGYQQWCKICRKDHKHDERKQYFRDFYHNNPEKYLEHVYSRKHGISLDEYNQLLKNQDGVCYLCKELCVTGRRLAVDHCHTSGKVRALLCSNCNKGLGCFKDNQEVLQKAIEYLKQFKND